MAPLTEQEKHVGALALLMFASAERDMFTTEQLKELYSLSQRIDGVVMTQWEASEAAISLLKRLAGS